MAGVCHSCGTLKARAPSIASAESGGKKLGKVAVPTSDGNVVTTS